MPSIREQGLIKDGIEVTMYGQGGEPTDGTAEPILIGPHSHVCIYNFGAKTLYVDSSPTRNGPWLRLQAVGKNRLVQLQTPGVYIRFVWKQSGGLRLFYVVKTKY